MGSYFVPLFGKPVVGDDVVVGIADVRMVKPEGNAKYRWC
jgi:hypothetical protein